MSQINPTTTADYNHKKNYLIPFIIISCLFFLWGLIHNFNGILIPHLKQALELNNRQSTLIDTSIYLAYFLMALPAGLIIKRFGYKKSIISGLIIFALGAFLFVPAANTRVYELFLLALFIIGSGLTLLETSANPYAAVLGPEESASKRLNLAASFNGLAAVVAPAIGSLFILTGSSQTPDELNAMEAVEKTAYLVSEAATVKMPYIILGVFILLVALAIAFIDLPSISKKKEGEHTPLFSVLKYKHLRWAVIAQLFYVGAQVCVGSFFIRAVVQATSVSDKTAAYYLVVYGFLFMAGRFIGTFLLRFFKDYHLLASYALLSVICCVVAINASGMAVVIALGAIGFFMSIMFPTIFSLGIRELKSDTEAGASLLVMSIIGGAILPYIMGTLIDFNHDIVQSGYLVPLLCFVVIAYFAIYGRKIKA